MKAVTSDELHGILLGIAKEFARICAAHDIPYYMIGGTMLGAVRHKGFIPWDDDMDFGVPREYFDKLTDLLDRELPGRYHVLTMDNSDALICERIKIEDTRTVVSERWHSKRVKEYGINIDIFPLDECNGDKGMLSKNRAIRALLKVQEYRFLYAKCRPIGKKILAYTIKVLFCWLRKRTIINFIERHLFTKGDYIVNRYGTWGMKEIVPSSYIIGGGKLLAFEDTAFASVACPDTYLSCLYGDYMQLPPENQRHTHFQDKYWK